MALYHVISYFSPKHTHTHTHTHQTHTQLSALQTVIHQVLDMTTRWHTLALMSTLRPQGQERGERAQRHREPHSPTAPNAQTPVLHLNPSL